MAYRLDRINEAVRSNPAEFMEDGDARFQLKVEAAAGRIIENMVKSPVVLLSGPSGSGKTTTARKIEAELERRGVGTHTISMDDYYKTIDRRTVPRTPDGAIDYESPDMLDIPLLSQHFSMLAAGREVLVPHFEFARQMRNDNMGTPLRLGKDEIAIFEGIHALNAGITGRHPEAARLYISARSDIIDPEGELVFKRTWVRLTRRAVRDFNFRGTDVSGTLDMWGNVRLGEKKYISPYKKSAQIIFDSTLPYEVPVMASYAAPMLKAVPESAPRWKELMRLVEALSRFEPIDPATVPAGSLLHEFIG